MKCRRCNTLNKNPANFCRNCGASLAECKGLTFPVRLTLFCFVVLFFLAVFAFLLKEKFFPLSPAEHGYLQKQQFVIPDEEGHVPSELAGESSPSPLPAEKKIENQSAVQSRTGQLLEVGQVFVFDAWGGEIAEIPAAVVDGMWLALPIRACLGGVKFVYYSALSDFSAEIDGVQWISGNDVGLWRLIEPLPETTFPLTPWQDDYDVSWFSLVSLKKVASFLPAPDWQHGYFLHTPVNELMGEAGFFVRNGSVSGWTFGNWLEGGYIWNRNASEANKLELSVDAFYQETFAGGREERFAQALAMEEKMPLPERMQMFLDGFLLPPKLEPQDVPENLLRENIIRHVRGLGREMRNQGRADSLVDLVDVKTLRLIGDFDMLKIVAGAALEGKGYEYALWLVEGAGDIFQDSSEQSDLDTLHVKLYQLWVGKLLDEGNNEVARSVLEKSRIFFADDPQLHLDGVLLFLREGDWQSAEGLLRARNYPSEMRDRVISLSDWIARMKGSESEIVIRFSPGKRHIPVQAIVNDEREIPFLVDTGASFVSIPLSFVYELGIVIDEKTPKRNVVTAGGIQTAWVVTLASIELEGWLVRNVEALVLDVADGNDFGLLGMNFLSSFQLELDSEKGVLILKPL